MKKKKTLFQEKKHHSEKKYKKHFCFLNTLAGRTDIVFLKSNVIFIFTLEPSDRLTAS